MLVLWEDNGGKKQENSYEHWTEMTSGRWVIYMLRIGCSNDGPLLRCGNQLVVLAHALAHFGRDCVFQRRSLGGDSITPAAAASAHGESGGLQVGLAVRSR